MRAFRVFFRRFSCVCLLMLLSSVCRGQEEVKPEDISQKVLPSVMTLTIETKDGKTAVATAFLAVKDGAAVTPWHMVKDAKKVTAKFSNGEEYESSGVIDKDEKRNVALIKIKMFGRPLLQFDATEPAAGSKAYAAIASQDAGFGISDATIDEIQTNDGAKFYKFTSTTPLPNSGGPLVNAKGEVIGVMARRTMDDKSVSVALPSAYVLGLDSTLATQPWDQVPSQAETPAVAAVLPNDVIDKQIAELLITICDYKDAYVYADELTKGVGYKNGISQTLYQQQQRVEKTLSGLSALRTDDPVRDLVIKEIGQVLVDCQKAGDLLIRSVVVAQDGAWGAQSKDLYSRSLVLINPIPDEKTVLIANTKELMAASTVLKEALPLEAQYALGLAARPSGFRLGVRSFVRNPFHLLVMMPGGFANKIGLYGGDKIISVGETVFQPTESIEEFKLLIKENLGQKLKVVVERAGKNETVTLKIPKEIAKEFLY